jgi:hypothetical protein
MADPQIEMINALATLLADDSDVVAKFRASGIKKLIPTNDYSKLPKPFLNLRTGEQDRPSEHKHKRVLDSNIIIDVVYEYNPNDPTDIFTGVNYVESVIYATTGQKLTVAGGTTNIPDEGSGVSRGELTDPEGRIRVLPININYYYHQTKT